MRSDILTEKLRYYAEYGNIDLERCIEIAHAAHTALVKHSNDGEMPQLAAAMVRCCGTDEDEAAYFRCAVNSFLQEKWCVKPENSAVFTGLMDMTYQAFGMHCGRGKRTKRMRMMNLIHPSTTNPNLNRIGRAPRTNLRTIKPH